MKHQLHKPSVLCLASFVISLSASAAFTRLATETYPGGGGVATNAVAGITTNGVPVALDAAKIAHLIIPEGGGPTGGVTKAYVDAHDLATLFASTSYTDSVKTNYLPLDGSKPMTGWLRLDSDMIVFNNKSSFNNKSGTYDYFDFISDPGSFTSRLTPDNTPVVTSNMLNGVLDDYLPLAGGTMTGDIILKSVDGAKIVFTNKYYGTYSIEEGAGALYFKNKLNDGTEYTSLVHIDGTDFLTAKKAETDYPAITNSYAYTDAATLSVSNVLMGALCATNDELRLAISAEANARLDGDTALQTALEAETARAVSAEDALTTALANEADDRAAGDTALQTALVETNALLVAAIDNEEDERKTADSKLLTKESPSYPATRNIKWSGYNLVLYGPMLFQNWDSIKAGTTATNEKLPDYITSRLASYQTNLVVSASTADKVLKNDGTTLYWGEGGGGGGGSPLAGAQYNFHNGTNFTWCIYATLTNALVKMGATVTNPPALDESALAHPIVVTASTATGSPLAGKTYDFHGGTNFVKSVYEALEQAVRDLGATTINTPTF